jgi:hypothetical protein
VSNTALDCMIDRVDETASDRGEDKWIGICAEARSELAHLRAQVAAGERLAEAVRHSVCFSDEVAAWDAAKENV